MAVLWSGGPTIDTAYYVVDFVAYVALLWWFMRRPLRQFAEARYERLVREIEEARRLRREAEERLATYEQRLANLDREIEGILAEAREAGERQRRQVLNEAT